MNGFGGGGEGGGGGRSGCYRRATRWAMEEGRVVDEGERLEKKEIGGGGLVW